jgi:glyoxylase-like metal-dependent hydrolase (beta-lactamase superfamily II)
VNGEAVQLLHVPAAHSDGDVIVFFRRSDVVAAGDIFNTRGFAVFDPQTGGSYRGTLAALNRLLEVTIPDFHQEAGTYVVPGHGHISDEADVAEFRNMSTIIHDRIQDLIKKGRTLEQVKAARPTQDYDGRFTKTAGEWTTDRFIDAVYRELAAPAPAPARRP